MLPYEFKDEQCFLVTLNKKEVDSVLRSLRKGGSIVEAIKFCRKVFTNIGLKEAKDYIENNCQRPFQIGDEVYAFLETRKGTIVGIHCGFFWVQFDGARGPTTFGKEDLRPAT